jgi:DnaJ-class molecular chaperone
VTAPLAPAEIHALARLLDELDYYQLLEIPKDAPTSGVKRAYHGLSRRFHPDANRGVDDTTRDAIRRIAGRLAEAYAVLRDPRRRTAYDAQLSGEEGPRRIPLAEAEARTVQKRVAESLGHTPNGRRFFALARAEIDRGKLDAAVRNIQMALTFEPDNAFFRQKLDEVRTAQRG